MSDPTLPSVEELKARIESSVAGATVDVLTNESPCAQHSLIIDREHGLPVARFLKNDAGLRLDYCSNVTGVDYPDRTEIRKNKVKRIVEGEEKEVVEEEEIQHPGFLESVYHLYSVEKGWGPVVLRMRTGNRSDDVWLPSLTPVWRSCEFQEREVFDLYGIRFEGHLDLRRLLMWDEFTEHPMRKDYVEPDDYEYEPTPHNEVLEKARAHR
ncbi:MAG: NADH-quinone oxidoreductase subunit C [Alphaproteobacteria bacterium]|nr:MAG: NADH-quinone oxidoreductase subunit C [Alphaproteobacteria bacterium]